MINLRDSRIQIIFLTLALVIIGLLFIYTAGALQAIRINKSGMYFLFKQCISFGIGLTAMFIAYRIPLDFYRKHVVLIYFLTAVMLIVVFFQPAANGAHRWIMLPVFSFQPSEVAKFTVVLYLAHYLDKKVDVLSDFMRGFLPASILVGCLAAMIISEPDFGTTTLILVVGFTLLAVGGARPLHLVAVVGFVVPILVAALLFGYRKGRLLSFLDPWGDRYGGGYQLIQSLGAVGSGGFLGKGIGSSTQKLYFLPEAHTDFIYAIIAEELGLIGAVFIFLLILAFFYIAVKSALLHRDRFKRLFLLGITLMIFYQSVMHIFVVLGLFPTKGITLPFMSYGGSALMMSLFFVGILLRGMEELECE